jgi:hypothetical protein
MASRILCPFYHRYSSQFIATSLLLLPYPPLLSLLMTLQRNLKIIETKEMRKATQVATNKTSQAKRKTGCKVDNAECDEF